MKGQNKSWKRYSSCVTLNHCLLTFLIVISSVNYSHGFWGWLAFWSSEEDDSVICGVGEFSCDSKRLCIRPHLICDGINDCDDGSDELSCPNVASIVDPAPDCMNGECPRSYKNKAIPPRCDEWDSRNVACRHHKGKPLIAFSTLDGLYETRLPVDRVKIHVNKTLRFDLSGISAFDYDNFDDLLIWLDENENKIFWGKFVQTISTAKVRMLGRQVSVNGTHTIHGFTYDWKNQALIWIDDYGIRSKRLYYEMEQTKLYLTLDPSYDRLGSITIDAKKRFIFWTNIGANPKRPFDFPVYIERIDISGEPKTKKIVETNIFSPVGLAIDTKQTKVYWIDSLFGTLNSVGYDGTNRITLYRSLSISSQVISMDIFSNYLYFTDNANSTIQRININNAVSKVDTLVSVANGPPTWVKIIDPRVMCSSRPKGFDSCIQETN
ncbi:low-density lipoprotein receptor-related protein 4-like [Tetranychus urticae]|uniref:Uncharacterized protein n=1 Tax=Tetranychus urticae TaxID=32264 RepID=T1KXJ9_TETUR|nr:low-density lipoprotein receptor-related protein 4-like [Tetranychus urticae]